MFKTDALGMYSKEAKQEMLDKRSREFTACNLEIHQLCEETNIMVMMEYAEENMKDGFQKDQMMGFLEKLNRQSAKIQHAVEQVESDLDVCERKTF